MNNNTMTDIVVKVDIGGKIFKTTQETLNKSGFFKRNMEFVLHPELLSQEIFFVNRSPKIFEHVLNLLRDSFMNIKSNMYQSLIFMK